MEKYLLNMPEDLKRNLTDIAKGQGFTLNGFILLILHGWIKAQEREQKGGNSNG